MANTSGRYEHLTDKSKRFRILLCEKRRWLLLFAVLLILAALLYAGIRIFGHETVISLPTPTPENSATATPGGTPSPTPSPTAAQTEAPTPVPSDTPLPTLPVYGDMAVYPSEDMLWQTPRRGTSTPKASMNVRTGPGSDYAPADLFGIGKRVTVFGQHADWYYIWYEGDYGWAHADLIALDAEKPFAAGEVILETAIAGETARLTGLPSDPALYRLSFPFGCMTGDAASEYRAALAVEQVARFSAREIAALAIGSRLSFAGQSVEVESLMWERREGDASCLLINDAYRIAYDAGLGCFCLVTVEEGGLAPAFVAAASPVCEVVFAPDATVLTPDAALWGDALPAASAAPAGELPTVALTVGEFYTRLSAFTEADFPPKTVTLEMRDGLVHSMYWSFFA